MKPVHSFVVTANLPHQISKLKELAYNYWWCWSSDAKELFNRMNRKLWQEVNHNPVLLLNKLTGAELEELAASPDFVRFLDYIYANFESYMQTRTWFDTLELREKGVIAYLSPEYGINESFPNYSGGLGALAGDHIKSASDMGLPLVGIGLLYQQGYFRQHLTLNGWQTELYLYNDFFTMPLTLMKNAQGSPIIISVDLPGGKAYAQIWRLNIGRTFLFFLDTNISQNESAEYREISNQLYGGDRETRIQQEIMLGIGGMRALKAMDIEPHALHINEGHAAFALLERTRHMMDKYHIDFHAAKQITMASSVFTTHTPVPAGNEAFRIDRVQAYFENYIKPLGLGMEEFLAMGHIEKFNPNEAFSMTVLGLRMTAFRNGVSKLHGEVSRKMWHGLWKNFPEDEVPIKHVTNGIHTLSWVAREFAELYDRYLAPSWRTETENPAIWNRVDTIPNEELWREKQRRRVRLVLYARDYLKLHSKASMPPEQFNRINEFLDPDALTVGFARRFATYKRATLLFRDMERLKSIVKNPSKPVQIIIAGKAHPHDTAGKEAIQSIIQKVRAHGLENHIVFLEDYDLIVARLMVKGCDVWLNNPIRPLEASGTSGMKAALNGTLNVSVLDGWWDEAYDGANGYAIGEGEERENNEESEIIESEMIYDLLESHIVETFYNRGTSRVPDKWVALMKNCIRTIAGQFSTTRMIKEYTLSSYVPALNNYIAMTANGAEKAKELNAWKSRVIREWQSVQIIDVMRDSDGGEPYVGKPINVSAIISLGALTPEDVRVEVVFGEVNHHGELINSDSEQLSIGRQDGEFYYYAGSYICPETGRQGFTVRVLPSHPMMSDPADLFLCTWA